ncbi:L,D-transpeptidase family protein [Tsuneonella sp. HG249]
MTSIATALEALSKSAMLVCSAGALVAIGAPAHAAYPNTLGPGPSRELRAEIAGEADELRQFYAQRGHQPLWIYPDGRATAAAEILLTRLDTAQFDGLDPRTVKRLRTRSLRRDFDRAARGRPEDVARAEIGLSKLFTYYVTAMRSAHRADMIYESRALAPVVPTAVAVLNAAGRAPSLDNYVREMGWMHPLYAPLRDAMDTHLYDEAQRARIWENLDRVRALPATPPERYVLVDAASARLWMYENGKPVDSMKVVVGKPESATPAMAGFIRYAIVNPYWNVPPDLVQKSIAPKFLKGGMKYWTRERYEVFSGLGDDETPLDPKTIDWKGIAAGAPPPYVRQKPGGPNFMGKVKYEFPNAQGIYLHDTPERALLKLADRQLSNGCVRLEDADRLGRWLLGKTLPVSKSPEQRVDLPTLVPVYITYLTAFPSKTGIAFRNDVYSRDSATRLAYAAE